MRPFRTIQAIFVAVAAVSHLMAATAVSLQVKADRYAAHLVGARAEGYRLWLDAPAADENFRLLIAGSAVRAELRTQVGIFPAGSVLLANGDSNDVSVLDPSGRTWYQTTFGAIDAKQLPSLIDLKTASVAIIADERSPAPGGTAHRLLELTMEVPLSRPAVAQFVYRVDVWSRSEPRLVPARRLLDVLMRRDCVALRSRFPSVLAAFPEDFPFAESVTPTVTVKGPGRSFPRTQATHRTLTVSEMTEIDTDAAEFRVPADYALVKPPF
jgi:hypothetical protein